MRRRDDALVRVALLLDRIGRFGDLIDGDREAFAALRAPRRARAARSARARSSPRSST
jgi:hypothetical protein